MNDLIRAIIFDYDGVVVNMDMELALSAANPYLDSFLIPPELVLTDLFYNNPLNQAVDLGQITMEEMRDAIRVKAWQGTREAWFEWWKAVDDSFKISPQMHTILEKLQGRYRLALLSDNHIGFRPWLESRPDIARYFDIVVCSAELHVKKPDRRIFLHAVQCLNVAVDACVFVDDHIPNTVAASALGMHAIHFRSIEQTRAELSAILGETL